MNDKFVGFLEVIETAPDTYLGAILVTNLTSVPVEFRVTLPVKPTSIQKSLYGESMVPYIGTELCGTQLLESITHDLDVVFVSPEYMLGVRPNSAAPVLFIEQAAEPAEADGSSNSPDGDGAELQKFWRVPSAKSQPVQLITAPKFAEDYDVTRPLVEELAVNFDLTEPFERINRAIEVLAQQDKRFARD